MISNYTVGYGFDAELANIELYRDYPDSLLKFAFACYVIFIILGIPGNLITIIALCCCKKFRNATSLFIINLHISNLLSCCMVLPILSANCIVRHWTLGRIMCNIFAMMKYGLAVTTRFTVAAITINRYIMVCHPLMYLKLYTRKSVIVSLLTTWVAGFILFVPSFFGVWGKYGVDNRGIPCTLIPDENLVSPKIFLTCIIFAGPYLIISVCYGCIWWTVRKKTKRCRNHQTKALQPSKNKSDTSDINQNESVSISSINDDDHNSSIKLTYKRTKTFTKNESRLRLPTRKDKKLSTMILAIIVSFVVCHLPLMLTRAIYGEGEATPTPHILGHILEFSTAFINPILYVIMSNEYRQAYKSLFGNMKSKLTGWLKS